MHCISCQSSHLVKNVGVLDRGHNNTRKSLTLFTQTDPGALIFKGNIEVPVRAHACADCGYVMMFANPASVKSLKAGNLPSP